eukprot:CAMPEP_0182497304 /NCGR_PEP_ID=MMETSP1321-20130603/5807_1 /TAXON_ID=91990 /ORGANISM="Bolidomonas sp., Strain RCC1657" /LENGTH=542 /DNA_ID=CAMNT_0024701143 /DNA_START=21 /DNA_END=1649 /DNA_ORIENTATION=+
MATDDDFAFSDEEEEEIDPATLCPDLYSAVQKNDTDKSMEFLEMEVPVDFLPEASDENNNKPCTWTMLHWAAFHGNVALTSALLENDANADYKEAKMSAKLRAQAGRAETAPFAVCMNTPLHLAATKGHLRVCWTLIQASYSVDDLDNVGNTPLHLAAAHKNKAVLNCLIEHASLAHKKNNFQNKAIDLCTDKECRALLKAAMSRPVLSEVEREEVQNKHLDELVDYEESIQSVDMDSKNINIEELEEKLRSGIEFGISSEVAELGENLIKELRLEQKLKKQINDLKENAPIITQTLYCDYVNSLEETVSEVQKLVDPESPDSSALSEMVETAKALCKTAHSEYWLQVATKSVSDVECATEATVKLMGRLKESIAKAGMNEANEDLISAGTKVHSRLTSEVELLRAKESFPTVKLPPSDPEEMSSKELKEYWVEDDPEKPINIGKIQETREWPLPPEDTGVYDWIPSVAYSSLKSACDRLSAALTSGGSVGANPSLLSEATDALNLKTVDVKILEQKNEEDKATAVAAAEKMAKKLKKKKKK